MKTITHSCDLCGDVITEVREIETAEGVELATTLAYVRFGGRIHEVCQPCLGGVKFLTQDRLAWAPHKEASVQRIAAFEAAVKAEDEARAEANRLATEAAAKETTPA